MAVWLQTSIWENRLKTLYLIILMPTIVFVSIFLWVFIAFREMNSEIIEFVFTNFLFSLPILTIWFFIAVFFQKQIIFKFSWAKAITRQEEPEIYNIVENLCISRGLTTPKIWILEDESMNAFATWWNEKSSWIVFSRGILNRLEKNEIEAVAAHELTHIINKDIKIMVLSTVFIWIVGTVWEIFMRMWFRGWKSDKDDNVRYIFWIIWIVLYLVWLIILPLVNLAISRKREYLADAGSVDLTKDREAMISALKKISTDARIESIQKKTVAAMCIANPLKKIKKSSIFSTHPSIEDRIKALQSY